MATPNDRDKAIAKSLLDQPGNEVWLEDIEDAIAAYREEIEAPLRAEIERLREALIKEHRESVRHVTDPGVAGDGAEEAMWREHRRYNPGCPTCAALATSAPVPRDSAEPAEERGPEVGALLWMAEHVMGADAAEALRGWLDHFRAEGRLVVRDAAGLEIAHYPEEGDR